MNDRECSRTSTNVWRSLCDHCELLANCNRKPIRHTFATGGTSITFETPQNDRECLRTATNVWRSFAIIAKSWRTAFVSPFAIYSPQCETSIRTIEPNRDKYKCICQMAAPTNGVCRITVNKQLAATSCASGRVIFFPINVPGFGRWLP